MTETKINKRMNFGMGYTCFDFFFFKERALPWLRPRDAIKIMPFQDFPARSKGLSVHSYANSYKDLKQDFNFI